MRADNKIVTGVGKRVKYIIANHVMLIVSIGMGESISRPNVMKAVLNSVFCRNPIYLSNHRSELRHFT